MTTTTTSTIIITTFTKITNIFTISIMTTTERTITITKIMRTRRTTSKPMTLPTLNPTTTSTIRDTTSDTTMVIITGTTMDTTMDTTTESERWRKLEHKGNKTISKPDIDQTQWKKTAATSALHSSLQQHESIVNATEYMDTYQALYSHHYRLPLRDLEVNSFLPEIVHSFVPPASFNITQSFVVMQSYCHAVKILICFIITEKK